VLRCAVSLGDVHFEYKQLGGSPRGPSGFLISGESIGDGFISESTSAAAFSAVVSPQRPSPPHSKVRQLSGGCSPRRDDSHSMRLFLFSSPPDVSAELPWLRAAWQESHDNVLGSAD
jgi:hypothetical protein